jgi:hypothetical protein
MKLPREFRDIKWIGLIVLVMIVGFKIYLAPEDFSGIALTGVGFVAYLAAFVISLTRKQEPHVLWDAERQIMAIIRTWNIEAVSASVLSSVPVGIDLSHSAKKVLQSMYARYSNEPGGVLVFFITRPIDNRSTRVGFMARRKTLRIGSGKKQLDNLSQAVTTDGMILERAMRAAYPHLPIKRAGFDDILAVQAGGIQTHVVV